MDRAFAFWLLKDRWTDWPEVDCVFGPVLSRREWLFLVVFVPGGSEVVRGLVSQR